MCWAGRATTIGRMGARGVPDPSERMTEARSAGYRPLAEELRVPVVDTARIAPEEGAAQVFAMMGARGDAAQRP